MFAVSPRPVWLTGFASKSELPPASHHGIQGLAIAQLGSPAAGVGRTAPQPAGKPAPTALQGVVLRRRSSENHFQMPPSVPPALLQADAAAAAKAAPTGQRGIIIPGAAGKQERLEAINS